MKNSYDYLIVGQGLAGSILAVTLSKYNKSFLVIDQGFEKASSKVAAGIINPLVLKRLTKSWRADDFSEFVPNFYLSLEELLQTSLYNPIGSYKLLSSEEEEKYWFQRFEAENLYNYMDPVINDIGNPALNFTRAGRIKRVAILNVMGFLTAYRKYLQNSKYILEEKFDFDLLGIKESVVEYKGVCAKKIIFCEGAQAVDNPFFKWLPFSLNKGELITIDAPNLDISSMLNKNSFVLPKQENEYIIGASNEWKGLDFNATDVKKEELCVAFKKISTIDFSVVKQEAGIRPATRDRRPFIGIHPEKTQLAIFNGMGAKAALMAPLLALEFVENLEKNKLIDKECNISRYYKLY